MMTLKEEIERLRRKIYRISDQCQETQEELIRQRAENDKLTEELARLKAEPGRKE